jgi:hypothetical protein
MTDKSDKPHDSTDMSHPRYDSAKDPSSPFYVSNKTEAEHKPDLADEDSYKVGPGRPPRQHTWKKGGRSPNPKGRPKKAWSLKPDIKKAFEDAIFGKVEVNKGDKKVKMAMIAIGMEKLALQLAKGDRHARRDVFQYAVLLGVDLQAKDVLAEALGVSDQAIVESYVQRRLQRSAGAAPEDHVKAPPDLIDDDVTKSEPNEQPATSPKPDKSAKKPAEPVLDEHGNPLPVNDIRHVQEMRARNLAQQKKNQGGS